MSHGVKFGDLEEYERQSPVHISDLSGPYQWPFYISLGVIFPNARKVIHFFCVNWASILRSTQQRSDCSLALSSRRLNSSLLYEVQKSQALDSCYVSVVFSNFISTLNIKRRRPNWNFPTNLYLTVQSKNTHLSVIFYLIFISLLFLWILAGIC